MISWVIEADRLLKMFEGLCEITSNKEPYTEHVVRLDAETRVPGVLRQTQAPLS